MNTSDVNATPDSSCTRNYSTFISASTHSTNLTTTPCYCITTTTQSDPHKQHYYLYLRVDKWLIRKAEKESLVWEGEAPPAAARRVRLKILGRGAGIPRGCRPLAAAGPPGRGPRVWSCVCSPYQTR